MIQVTACPICDSNDLREVTADIAPFLLIRAEVKTEPGALRRSYCADCDFSFFNNRLDPHETASLYRDYRGAEYRALRERLEPGSEAREQSNADRDNSYHRDRIRQTAQRLAKWNVQPRRVLDHGGEADAWLAKAMFPQAEVAGYDLSVGSPLPTLSSFDLVISAHVLEHVSFPVPFVRELSRFLAPGGVVYAEVPYDPVGALAETMLEGHPLNRMHEHISFFTPLAVARLMAASGLEPVHLGAIRFEPYYRAAAVVARRPLSGQEFCTLPDRSDILELDPADDLFPPIQTEFLSRVNAATERWRSEGRSVVLYPAGQYSMELLAGTTLGAVVVGLGDGNERIRGQVRMGKRVYAPEDLPSLAPDLVLITSPLHEMQIAERLAQLAGPALRVVKASAL